MYLYHDLQTEEKFASCLQMGKNAMVWITIGYYGKTKIVFIMGKIFVFISKLFQNINVFISEL